MIKVEWDYMIENSCSTDRPVAILKLYGSKDTNIIYVYESDFYHYSVISPDFSFIKPKTVYYSVESLNVKSSHSIEENNALPGSEYKLLELKEGCKIIEEDFFKQVQKILELLS